MIVRTGQSTVFILCHFVSFYVSLTLCLFTSSIFNNVIRKYYSNTTIKAESKLLRHSGRHSKYLFHTKAHKSFWNNYIQFSPRDVIYRWNSPLELIVNGIFVACFPMLLSFCTWFRKRFMESHNYFKKAAGKVFFHHVYKSLLMLYRELCSLCLL